jgi:hypothetical protein
MARVPGRFGSNLLESEGYIFISLRRIFISLCGVLISLRFGFNFLALLLSIPCQGRTADRGDKKVQFLAPNPLKTLSRLQKRRALLP